MLYIYIMHILKNNSIFMCHVSSASGDCVTSNGRMIPDTEVFKVAEMTTSMLC